MTSGGKPPRFKPSKKVPMAVSAQKALKIGNYRGSPRERGYDARFDAMSLSFRRRNPFCWLCDQEGRVTLTDVTDHMIPVQDRPDLSHDWKNFAPLCFRHNASKKAWEAYARQQDLVDLLPTWVKDPSSRPPQFRCE